MGKSLKLIYGEGEIKRIDSQIRKAFDIIDKIKPLDNGVSYKQRDEICKLGFRYVSSSGDTFIGDRQVIKIGYFTRRPPPLKYRVPTLIYAFDHINLNSWYDEYALAIQPKVNLDILSRSDMASYCNYFENKLVNIDAHSGNFGVYRGKVKLFDW
jgi:hypothetical protein